MRSISSLVPQTREVKLADWTFKVSEMTVTDLAAIQSWLEATWECPLDSLRDDLRHLQGPERTKALRDIWDACEAGAPIWGEPRASQMLSTGAGLVELFRVILSRNHPELIVDENRNDFEAIAEATSNHPDGVEQYESMIRAWQPAESIEELSRLLSETPESSGPRVTWVQAVMELCEQYKWSIEYVMGMTLRQMKAARTLGKPIEYGTPVAPKTNLKALVAAKKRQIVKEQGESNG
jgi:hypothetical protein